MATLESAVWIGVSVVTLLGDPLVIGGLGLAVYWFGDRIPGVGDHLDDDRRTLFFATIVGVLALSTVLKTGFAVDRPPGAAALPGIAGMPGSIVPIYTWIVGPGGYAFPSGHATAATVGWLGLTRAVRGKHRDRTLALGGGVVVAVAASRVVLGVHRPHEVLAGIAVGVAYVLVTFDVLERPRRAFALAGLIGTVGPIVTSLTGDSLLVVSIALGTTVGWELTRERDDAGATGAALATLSAALLVAGVTFVRSGAIETAVTLVGVGGGAAILAGRRVRQDENG